MPFKSKKQARAAFAGAIPGFDKKKAKEWAKKTDFKKIPDSLTESVEVTSGVKAPTPEVTSGVEAPKPEVTSGLDGAKKAEAAKVENKKLDVGEAKTDKEVTSGVEAPKPEVKTGLDNEKPEVTSITKESAEVTSGVKAPTPEVEEGVKAPKPEVTSGLKEEEETKENGEEVKAPTEGFEGKMDETYEAKYKSLEEKFNALKTEMEELEHKMSCVKELGEKKFLHSSKKEEIAKLGEEIKALKEKSKDRLKFPTHDREGNKHMPKPTQNIPSKKWKAKKSRTEWKKELDEKAKVLSEGFTNAYVQKASKENLISERVLTSYWEKAVKMQEEVGPEKNRSNKSFWYGVVNNFNKMLNEQEIARAKEVMTEREKFGLNTIKFIDCIASDNYIDASRYMNSMVESSLKSIIDTSKVQYQKELGEKVTKKLREV